MPVARGDRAARDLTLLPGPAEDHRDAGLHPALDIPERGEPGDLGLHPLVGGPGGVERPVAVPVVAPIEDALDGLADPRLGRTAIALPVRQHHRDRGRAAPDVAAVRVDHLRVLGKVDERVPRSGVAGLERRPLGGAGRRRDRDQPHRRNRSSGAEETELHLVGVGRRRLLPVQDQRVDRERPIDAVGLEIDRVALDRVGAGRPWPGGVPLRPVVADVRSDLQLDPRAVRRLGVPGRNRLREGTTRRSAARRPRRRDSCRRCSSCAPGIRRLDTDRFQRSRRRGRCGARRRLRVRRRRASRPRSRHRPRARDRGRSCRARRRSWRLPRRRRRTRVRAARSGRACETKDSLPVGDDAPSSRAVRVGANVALHSAAADGSPQEENLQGTSRQAPRSARDRVAARQRLPDLPAAEAPASRVPDVQDVQGPRDRAAPHSGALATPGRRRGSSAAARPARSRRPRRSGSASTCRRGSAA